MFSTASETQLLPNIKPPLGGKLLKSASFSSDCRFLLIAIASSVGETVTARMFRWLDQEHCYEATTADIELNGRFRHPVGLESRRRFYDRFPVKFDSSLFQVFKLHDGRFQDVTATFPASELIAATTSFETGLLVTASPGGILRLWNLETLQPAGGANHVLKLPRQGSPYLLGFGPSKDDVASLIYTEPLQILDITNSSSTLSRASSWRRCDHLVCF